MIPYDENSRRTIAGSCSSKIRISKLQSLHFQNPRTLDDRLVIKEKELLVNSRSFLLRTNRECLEAMEEADNKCNSEH